MDLIVDEDEDGDATDASITTSSEGLSMSLFIEVFKEIAGCALDELVMACSQLRLRQPGEPVGRTKAERLYKLERVEVPVRAAELEAERVAADFDLRDKMAQMRYLFELRSEEHARREQQAQQTRTDSTGSESSQATQSICAVCLQEFTETRAIFPCAHVFCTGCIANLTGGRRSTRKKSVRCPTCRRVCPVENITTVVEGSASDLSSPENQIQAEVSSEDPLRQLSSPNRFGSLGSKLDALLGRVDMLRQENPGVKCLLFSQWSKMLELAVQALPRLGVRCFVYGTKHELPKLLSQFQACPAACVLALPFKVGANGLNIVEATEVILVEPLLSTSIEAQAVNRVHRLGQARRTRIHRFIVQGSIEERIYRLGHKHKANIEQTEHEEPNDFADDDDDEELQRLGVAPGRKEQEKLTMQDLQELLRGNADAAASGHQQANAGTVQLFWEEMVVLNERSVSRQTAFMFLERRYAALAREETQIPQQAVGEPQKNYSTSQLCYSLLKNCFNFHTHPTQFLAQWSSG